MIGGGAWRVLAVLAVAAMLVGACGGTIPVGTEPSTASPTSTLGPPPSSILPAGSPVNPPPGTSRVAVTAAGIAIPVPDGWQRLDAEDLLDPAVRRELATAYPGANAMLEAIVAAGDRTEIVFLAVDPAASGTAALPASIAVLVAQPSVSGLLLEFATGFIDAGLRDTLDVDEPDRQRVQTPVGEAIRLAYAVPEGTEAPTRLVAWVIGAPQATVLITTVTLVESGTGVDPDALIAAIEVR